MDKPLDKVNFAFNGFYGENMAENTRNRIYWIISNTVGKSILDIGCSQGITCLLLGREGKKAYGIDSLSESIEVANKELLKEEDSIRENIKFICDDIINSKKITKYLPFDTIILGEILEHFGDSNLLLERAYKLGHENTRYIITVPFGVNDYFDHKKTYYYYNLHNEVSKYFNIDNVSFMGKWVGITAKKKKNLKEVNTEFDTAIIYDMEKNFYKIEKNLLEQNRKLRDKIEKSDKYLKELLESIYNNSKEINNIKNNIDTLINSNK